jgi:filamentous hemagglutinin family protein
VTITQNQQSAYLYWKSFNVGAQTTVNFTQSGNNGSPGTWIAFNKVMTASDPTHIFGTINGQGQVWIQNQNGILFHSGSKVNVQSLVASTLPINPNLAGDPLKGIIIGKGIANNADYQFLFSALPVSAGTVGPTVAWTPSVSGPVGDVKVEPGSVINSSTASSDTRSTIPAGRVLNLSKVDGFFVGQAVTGSGIPSGTTIVAVDSTANTITLSTEINQSLPQSTMITAMSGNNSGGLVALIGPNVLNQGVISTPNGQTVLAAGLQVGMAPHPSSDPSLRGLDFYVGKISDPSISTVSSPTGSVENDGLISIPEGNVTLIGKSVRLGSFSWNLPQPLSDGTTIANGNGSIASTTSVSFNGRIDLLASYNTTINDSYLVQGSPLNYGTTGDVVVGNKSVMQILPEWSSSSKINGSSLALNSMINILGNTIDLKPDSVLISPGAVKTAGSLSQFGTALQSGVNVDAGSWYLSSLQTPFFVHDSGSIKLESGAIIDVSGSVNVPVDTGENFVTIQLRGAQLAGEVLQNSKQNPIYGQDLTVDIRDSGTFNGVYWIGTPLGDATGYAALVQRGVGELTVNGGTVSLNAGGSVELQSGSLVNVSSGWIQYSGGSYGASELINSFGQLVPINKATPNVTYTSIVKNPPKVYEDPYLSGGNGGGLSIQAPSALLNGDLRGISIAGERQVRASATSSQLPSATSLSILLASEVFVGGGAQKVSQSPETWAISQDLTAVDGFKKLSIINHDGSIVLPSSVKLDMGPLGSLNLEASTIDIQGSIAAPGGSVSMTADLVPYSLLNAVLPNDRYTPVLDVLSMNAPLQVYKGTGTTAVTIPAGELLYQYGNPSGGNVQVIASDGSLLNSVLQTGSPNLPLGIPLGSASHWNGGVLTLESSSAVSISGTINDDRPISAHAFQPVALSGGSISLSGFQVIENGSLNVSGGALQNSKGITLGQAGAISISAGQDPAVPDIHWGSLVLNGVLSGYSPQGVKGGSLSIKAPAIAIGHQLADPLSLSLTTDFFSSGGFSQFFLTGLGREIQNSSEYVPGISIQAGTVIAPTVISQYASDFLGDLELTPFVPHNPYGTTVSLALAASGLKDTSLNKGFQLLVRGDLLLNERSTIILSPEVGITQGVPSATGGSVSLSGGTVAVEGSIFVPGGSISIAGAPVYPSNVVNKSNPQFTVDVGNVTLSASGQVLNCGSPIFPFMGVVMPGGAITVSGNALLEGGAKLQANGSEGLIGVPFSELGQVGLGQTPVYVDSAGGSITLSGGQILCSYASLTAAAGGNHASGGKLSIASGRFYQSAEISYPYDITLAVSATSQDQALPGSFSYSGIAALGPSVIPFGGVSEGGGHIATDSFQSGGFSEIDLNGNVNFTTPVSISAPYRISLGSGGIIQANSQVILNSPYLVLGSPFADPLPLGSSALTTVFGTPQAPEPIAPSPGTGILVVNSSALVDIGNLSLQGISSASLLSPGGSIRGDGTLDVAGSIVLKAANIYPSTAVSFTVAAYNGGMITVTGSGSPSTPLSAGGTLSLYADQIIQGGVLEAPFGSINLGAGPSVSKDPLSGNFYPTTSKVEFKEGSITSVTGMQTDLKGLVLPYGSSPDGSTWIAPNGADISNIGIPTKSISINAASITADQGAQITMSLQGGGALYATQWISGLGGNLNLLGASPGQYSSSADYSLGSLVSYGGAIWSARQNVLGVTPSIGPDWTALPNYYAIVPGLVQSYESTGYAVAQAAGSQIVVPVGAEGLAAGTYTMMPASYGTLPGAYLISAIAGNPQSPFSVLNPDGTAIVSGRIINSMDSSVQWPSLLSQFQIIPPSVLSKMANYSFINANTFFSTVPNDSTLAGGNLTLVSSVASSIDITRNFFVKAAGQANTSGAISGGLVTLSSPGIFTIGATGSGTVLDPKMLGNWEGGGLLIGGSLSSTANGFELDTQADRIVVDSGVSLVGNDVILAANQSVTIGGGATVEAIGSSLSPVEKIINSGNGVLFRVSADPEATFARSGASQSSSASIALSSGVSLSGSSVLIDSSGGGVIDPSVGIVSKSVSIAAGTLALIIDGTIPTLAYDLAAYESQSLVLAGNVLSSLQQASSLSFTGYQTIDFYGSSGNLQNGSYGSQGMAQLSFHTGAIRGFDMSGKTSAFSSQVIVLDNNPNASAPKPLAVLPDGYLEFDAATIQLGNNSIAVDQFANVSLNATGAVVGTSTGSFSVGTSAMPGNLFITSPLITASAGKTLTVITSGDLVLQAPDSGNATASSVQPGAGATLNFTGYSIYTDTTLSVPSGSIVLHATVGDVTIGGQGKALLDVSGVLKRIQTSVVAANAGTIRLVSDAGNVALGASTSLNLEASSYTTITGDTLASVASKLGISVAHLEFVNNLTDASTLAPGTVLYLDSSGVASAGSLTVSAPNGAFSIDPAAMLYTSGAAKGNNGSFSLDVATLNPSGNGPSLISSIISQLGPDQNGNGGFTSSQSFRIRTGDVDVDTYIKSHSFSLSVDQGMIDVTPNGVVDASGATGGSIALQASGSVILEPNSLLNVHGDTYDSAGKGGVVFLSAGAETAAQINPNAVLDLQTASAIDLGVTAAPSSSQDLGGVLHLRAPITQDGTDIQISHLDSTISGASSIEVEGYRTYDLTGTSGEITQSLRQQVNSDAQAFYGSPVGNSGLANAIMNRLAANQPTSVSSVMNLAPGVEIINQSGDLTLNQDWDFSMFRVGAHSAPGFLTLRASGNITLNASLSDGFTSGAYTANLMPLNLNAPINFQSWGYKLAAGSDFSSASASVFISSATGDVNLGISGAGPVIASGGPSALTSSVLGGASGDANYYQVIRTGTGEILVSAAGNIHLWNQFASIYSAGSVVSDPSMGGIFDAPTTDFSGLDKTSLGAVQQSTPYPSQFSQAGGNVTLQAGGEIAHLAITTLGQITDDSTMELPSSWLYRRGALDPTTGKFVAVSSPSPQIESTSWWVDFSNFFEGVGALGGGNVSMTAGGSIRNIDAAIPTNYRMPGHVNGSESPLVPNAASAIELGGGDLVINAQNNLDAGVYYVERGIGSITVGGSIVTNQSRDTQLSASILPGSQPNSSDGWLPMTLFTGKSSFNLAANGSVLLGPVANALIMPQGYNNSVWYKSYFSTYSPESSVNVLSLGGSVTIRTEAVTPQTALATPLLQLWYQDFVSPVTSALNGTVAYYDPWLRTVESLGGVNSLSQEFLMMPPSLKIESPSGDITLQGNISLSPSAVGGLEMVAGGQIQGLAPYGQNGGVELWNSSMVNVSDADPKTIPDPSSPASITGNLLLQSKGSSVPAFASATSKSISTMVKLSLLLSPSGSNEGVWASLLYKQLFHDQSLLHSGDFNPVQMLAGGGDISGLTLFSPKMTDLIASGNITDIGLYLQHTSSSDLSIVAAGGNIIAYDPGSVLQKRASVEDLGVHAVPVQSGDIQVGGPGTLEVIAGGNVDLGQNPGVSDATINTGITSVGNEHNPTLPFQGADLIVSAGVKLPSGLSSQGALALDSFARAVVNGADGETYLSELSAQMAYSGDPLLSEFHSAADFGASSPLTPEQKAKLELQLFYIVLRDVGRNYSNPDSPEYRSYDAARQAIKTVMNGNSGTGDILTWSQDIATVNGGNINLFAPGGGVTMGAINYKTSSSSVAPGLITEGGGAINIFTKQDVFIGIGRIFTLKGGDIMIWSDQGNIAAGASSKTVQSAPPTQVLVDPQSALVETDLAGLATGGGIGTLETVIGIPPSAVDLDAPSGVIDAGDAGIRSSGNLHLAATAILNADNIAVGGLSVGVPPPASSAAPAAAPASAAPPAAAPSSAASTAAAAASSAADKTADKSTANQDDATPSVFSIDIMGYGGGEGDDDDSQKKAADTAVAPVQASL